MTPLSSQHKLPDLQGSALRWPLEAEVLEQAYGTVSRNQALSNSLTAPTGE